MREGVLCWYPFAPDAAVLDLSGGALTELLNSRCGQVAPSEAADGRFDVIVLLDPEDFSADALKRLRGRLNPHGRLLLVFENPFALRYWSGKASPKTGRPYDPLFGRDGRPGKAETRNRLKQAGFEGQKWYYPLTDHWFTTEVYSENYLPNEHYGQRFFPYTADDGNLRFDERPLYREIIRGGAFEFMCGAYMVEARVCAEDEPCPVDYAAVTAYRAPEKRFATTVRNDGTVRKRPLHPDGYGRLAEIRDNHGELNRLGINTLQVRLEGGELVMPRLELPTLWDYWADKLADGSLRFEEMVLQFDRIRGAIIQATASGKCYWELVPANCFYDARKDELLFFDQEYYWPDRPPELALTRALGSLRYSPVFQGDKRSEGWLAELIRRYGLSERWEELSKTVNVEIYREVFGYEREPLERETMNAERGIKRRMKSKAGNGGIAE
jgi:hypothetical protein